jgi:hypothetical protein
MTFAIGCGSQVNQAGNGKSDQVRRFDSLALRERSS